MTDILLDTDVLVDFLQGHPSAVEFVETNATHIVLSSVTVAELFAGAKAEEQEELEYLTEIFSVQPITTQIARTGGILKAKYGRSHGLGLADALIAATAQYHGLEVRTLNVRHFPMFPELEPPYRK